MSGGNSVMVEDIKIGILDIVKEYSAASKKESLLEVVQLESKELKAEIISKCDKAELNDIIDWSKDLLKGAEIARNLLSIPKGTGHRCIFQNKKRDCPHYSTSANKKRRRESADDDDDDGDDDGDDDDDDDDGGGGDDDDNEWVACECRRIVVCDACKPQDPDSDEEDENVLDSYQQMERDYGLESCLCQKYYCGDCEGEREHCAGDHGGYSPLLCSECCSADCEVFCEDCAHSDF